MRKYRFRRKKTVKRKIFAVLLVFTFIALSAALRIAFGMRTVLRSALESGAKDLILATVNKSISNGLSEKSQARISEIKYNGDGTVSSVYIDTAELNRRRTEIVSEILEGFSESSLSVSMPIGIATGINLLAKVGPQITLEIDSAPAIKSDLRHEFLSVGINQTLHRIVLDVSVESKVFMPSAHFSVAAECSVCLEESVIVGKVPDAYTEIHRGDSDISETDIDDIYDFGASSG